MSVERDWMNKFNIMTFESVDSTSSRVYSIFGSRSPASDIHKVDSEVIDIDVSAPKKEIERVELKPPVIEEALEQTPPQTVAKGVEEVDVTEYTPSPEDPSTGGGGDGQSWLDALEGYAATAAPWVAVGTQVLSGFMKYKAAKEKGRQDADNLRRRGDYALRKAEREKKEVITKERFKRAETQQDLANTGLFSGKESFESGQGIQGIIEATTNAAKQLAADIMTEGQRQKAEYYAAADATEKAAKKSKLGIAVGTVSGVAGGFIGRGKGK